MQENVTVGADVLLTVKEAARRREVSTATATVYALRETVRLANARISTHSIRIRDSELKAYGAACRVGK
jgi:hypothetical protein